MRETKEMYPSWGDDHGVRLGNVKIKDLHNFKEHPFHVVEDTALFELAKSIEDKGVLVPLIVRANPYGAGYEIIAGHRRKAACKWAGLSEVPVMIVELDDNEAVIAMIDSNLQREHIKPSEKAFAYKMKLEAMKQQGKRTDLTFCQVGKKSVENPTLSLAKVGCGYDENGRWQVTNEEVEQTPIDSNKQLAMQLGESQRQIARYIRLTNLIPKILTMVDEEKIAFTVAVELSYLKEEEQYELHAIMDLEQCTPSLSQACRLKVMSQHGTLDMDAICMVLEEEKPNQREQIKFRADSLAKYFPKDYTSKQKTDLIEQLLKEWYEKQEYASRRALAAAWAEQDKGMEVVAMSREISTYEAMGGTYTEVDGVLYPNIVVSEKANAWVGKYGLLWIDYMKFNYAEGYRHHIRMGTLNSKAFEVNEEAYEMLERIANRYLAKHKPQNSASTMEKWRLREQAKQMAEEVVLCDIVRQYH